MTQLRTDRKVRGARCFRWGPVSADLRFWRGWPGRPQNAELKGAGRRWGSEAARASQGGRWRGHSKITVRAPIQTRLPRVPFRPAEQRTAPKAKLPAVSYRELR